MMNAEAFTKFLFGEWRGSYGLAACPVCQPEQPIDWRALRLCSQRGKLVVTCYMSGCDLRTIAKVTGLSLVGRGIGARIAGKVTSPNLRANGIESTSAEKPWVQGKPIKGTKGEAYLRRRGITCALPKSLRWVEAMDHPHNGQRVSALEADLFTGGVHRTFFDKTRTRLEADAEMTQGPCYGGAVVLSECNEGSLRVCTRIETGLSFLNGIQNAPQAVWATLSASSMRSLQLPAEPRLLSIEVDSFDGEAGRRAAEALGNRAFRLGWPVMLMSAPFGMEWNESLCLQRRRS